MRLPGFVGPSATSADFNADCERTINLIPEVLDPSGEGRTAAKALILVPGLTERYDLSPGPVRAEFTEPTTGRAFAISGYVLYELFANGTSTNRGSVALDANPATICANSAVGQLFISSGDVGYCYELATDTLTVVLASGSTMSRFMDGRFLSLDAATSTFYISDLNDGLTWDPTQFAQRTGAGDPWVSMLVVNLDIWLVGTETAEVWYDSGAFPFPFVPRPDALVQHGTIAPYSLAALGDVVIWISRNQQGANMIVRNQGYAALKLSTLPVDLSLEQMSDTSDAVAFVYQKNGHQFYVVNFPNGSIGWAFDASSGLWCERGYWNSVLNEWQAIRFQTHMLAFGMHLVGDRLTGTVYEMRDDVATDVDGNGIRWLRRFMGVRGDDHKRVKYPRLEIVMQTGSAPLSGQGSDPLVMLRTSNDSGHSWGPERTAGAGVRGDYAKRVFWTRLGTARDRVFELTGSDPLPWRLTDCFAPGAQELLS